MGTRKKVHAYVRVKPTDDFAHEMIQYGDDNKVSTVCLPSPPWASLCLPSMQSDPVSKQHFNDPNRIGTSSDGI